MKPKVPEKTKSPLLNVGQHQNTVALILVARVLVKNKKSVSQLPSNSQDNVQLVFSSGQTRPDHFWGAERL